MSRGHTERERSCKLCGANVPQNVAAHLCPHASPCRYRLRPDGSVLDWTTPECEACKAASNRPRLSLVSSDASG